MCFDFCHVEIILWMEVCVLAFVILVLIKVNSSPQYSSELRTVVSEQSPSSAQVKITPFSASQSFF